LHWIPAVWSLPTSMLLLCLVVFHVLLSNSSWRFSIIF
jgi:hypothetical protein